MKMRLSPLILLLPLLAVTTTRASDDQAETRLKAAVDEVVGIAKSAKDRTSLINEEKAPLEKILNFQIMTRRAVGPGWRQFTPEQQSEAVKLFTSLIMRTYTAKFTPGVTPTVVFKSTASPQPGREEITTTSDYKGSNYDVIYRMEQNNGQWEITDVVIEGVSLVANYRSQFDGQFKQGGVNAVLLSLRKAVSESK
jgi:phospholipid transport system substrate-binding protein